MLLINNLYINHCQDKMKAVRTTKVYYLSVEKQAYLPKTIKNKRNQGQSLGQTHSSWDFNLPSFTSRFHFIGNSSIFGPYVVLPFPDANQATQDSSRMNSDPHIDVQRTFFSANIGG